MQFEVFGGRVDRLAPGRVRGRERGRLRPPALPRGGRLVRTAAESGRIETLARGDIYDLELADLIESQIDELAELETHAR